MRKFSNTRRAALLIGSAIGALALGASVAWAETRPITIPPQSLADALHDFASQTGRPIMFSPAATGTKQTLGVDGVVDQQLALGQLLQGTGLTYRREGEAFVIVQEGASDPQSGSAAGDGADSGTVQALIVTAQKREENIQDVPIAMSAFTQEDLTRSQVAGGPDLMTQIPNMTFTKTNFSSYSIQIRGIGTQAISATTDAAVAVAFNNTPFIRNRFFEQEFYDLQRVEVLRGPQGTLYGRNATAGVVNIISQKPKFTYEAKVSADLANYNSTRLEGMVNLPLADDKVALRLAGAWTKRNGYDVNQITGNPIDGRDLWSTRASLRIAPADEIEANLVWEHFEENDDRLRSGKQLCHQDDRTEIAGRTLQWQGYSNVFSQGCLPASLYGPESYEAPNGWSLPYYLPLSHLDLPIPTDVDPYASLVQSPDLRIIESTVDPKYTAKNDLVELQLRYELTHNLTLTSETGYSFDRIFSMEDYNRFNTSRGAFLNDYSIQLLLGHRPGVITPGEFGGIFCDPQIGCADRIVAIDVSTARSRQFSEELRLSSDFEGRFNFSLGANFLRYDTMEKYYVFINTLSMFAAMSDWFVTGSYAPYAPGVTDNHECIPAGGVEPDPRKPQLITGCIYMDPNPIGSLNDLGHDYFLSKNPYKLISYAMFGEAYYNITDDLKLTAGLRWTVDKKEAPRIPSWVLAAGTLGYPVLEVEKQEWREPTGRLALDWKPHLSFTDQSLLYASYARGYKAGGSNPPRTGVVSWGLAGTGTDDTVGQELLDQSATKPKTFGPEFVNAYEIGTKNTLRGGRVTLNANAFYYDYTGYQISQIVDRAAVNYNFDAEVWGMELEADWRPIENLNIAFKGGYEKTRVADGMKAVDVMDRTAGHPGWIVVRPFPTYASNCIVPLSTVSPGPGVIGLPPNVFQNGFLGPCEIAYVEHLDPVTSLPYTPNPTVVRTIDGGTSPLIGFPGYAGYDPTVDVGQNNGEGFYKDLSGHELPNAPHFTATLSGNYTIPLPNSWLATMHTDLYYQSEAWTRIFNTPGYDKLKAYTNVNLAAIFSNEDLGWKLMAYVKNVLDKDNITGAFLNSDDTGLTTNVFLNEPRLYGLRVTKEWSGGWWNGANPNHPAGEPYPFTVELGGSLQRHRGAYDPVESAGSFTGAVDPARAENRDLDLGEGGEVKLTYLAPGAPWRLSAGYRFGKAKGADKISASRIAGSGCLVGEAYADTLCTYPQAMKYPKDWLRGDVINNEKHVVADFAVGRDVGLGSAMSAGVRYVDLQSSTRLRTEGVPDWIIPQWNVLFDYSQHHFYNTNIVADRNFKGLGPTLSLDVSKGLIGSIDQGRLNLDASATAGVLFGKQKTSVGGTESATYYDAKYLIKPPLPTGPAVVTTQPAPRTKSASVPLLSAALGFSYEIQRVRISTGYRWERYYNALDAGFTEHKSYDRTMDGPYFKVAIGFGG